MTENVSTKLTVGEVRLSYVHIFQPEAVAEGGEKKYSVSVIIPKSNKKLVDQIKLCIEAAIVAGVGSRFGGKRPTSLKTPLRDGDLERPDDPAYAGCYFLNANSDRAPGIQDQARRGEGHDRGRRAQARGSDRRG